MKVKYLSLLLLSLIIMVGLPGTADAAISINNTPSLGSTSVTAGSSVNLTLSVTTSGSGTANDWSSFSWQFSGGATTCNTSPNFTGSGTRSGTYAISAPTTPGVYSLNLIAYNSNDCSTGSSTTYPLSNVLTVYPTVSSIALTGASPTNAASVSWTVTFSASVTGVDASDFSLASTGITGALITGVSGSGNTRTVTASTGSGSGTLGLNLVDDDSIVSNSVALGGTGTANGNFIGASYTLDRTPPTVSSIALGSASPTAAASVTWTVTFSKSVTGVGAADFALVASGVTGAAITSVSGSGATWTVTASTGSGSGSLGLNLVDDDSIQDALGNRLGGTGAGNGNLPGEVYDIDRTPPAVVSIATASPNPTAGAATVSWTVTFSEPVTAVDAADFALVQTGITGATINSVTGSGTTWTVTASTGLGLGSLGLNLVDNDTIVDARSNRLGGAGTGNGNFTGAVYAITDAPCNQPGNIPAGVSVSCVCDNFHRSNLDPSTIFGQNWITSESDGTGVLPSIVNSDYLRLTGNETNRAKAATVPAAFPAAGNYISVEFNYYAYNGTGADGIAVTLSDYNVPAVPGAYGGSLGYAQKTGINGFTGGWIGVALDEYGNYSNNTEGRSGGPGFRQDSVGVRGSGSGTTGYPWLTGTAANLSPGIDASGTTRAPGHRYQIVVDARNAGASTPQTFVAVNRDTTGSGASYGSLIAPFNVYALNPAQVAVPTNWQISFTGSTGGSTNIHEIGALRICAQTVVSSGGGVASGFSVIDEAYGTPAIAVQNYLTGRIYTKLAGTPFKLNVAAINSSNQIQTGYVVSGTKSVDVKLVDNSDGVCVLNSTQANYCSAACRTKGAVTGGSQTLSFVSSNAGQKQSADFTIPGAWSNLVAIVSDGSTTACSTDAFSVRPLSFNTLSSTANNAALTGTPALRAGTDSFSMTVSTATTGYAGAAAVPSINSAGMTADTTGWTLGALSPGSFPAAIASSSTGTNFTYSEVGHFRFLGYDPAANTTSPRGVYDGNWTAVDQGTATDCIAGSYANIRDTSGTFAGNSSFGKYGCLFGITASSAFFGRFIPDRFTLVSGSVAPACVGTTRSFTYMDQSRLGVAYKIEARNGLDAKTVNYDATLFGAGALPVPELVAEDQDAANQGCHLNPRMAGLPVASWVAGVYDASTATASFKRPTVLSPLTLDNSTPSQCAATRQDAGGPFWSLDLGVLVNDGAAVMAAADMNANTTGTCSGVGCNARKLGSTGVVLGRLNMLNAYGSDVLPLLVPVRAEYWNGSAWLLNTDDKCTSLSAANLGVGNVTQAVGSSLAVTSASLSMSPATTLSGGVGNFRINPATRGSGSVDLALNLGAGLTSNVNWCGSWSSGPAAGTGTAPSPDLSFLTGNWCGSNADRAPAARIRFGSPKVPFIYLRERY